MCVYINTVNHVYGHHMVLYLCYFLLFVDLPIQNNARESRMLEIYRKKSNNYFDKSKIQRKFIHICFFLD